MDKYQTNWQTARHAAVTQGLSIIEHGWEQHVIIDQANGLVYRYPRHQAAAEKLADEVGLLRTLHTYTWSVAIPLLRHHTTEYTVYDFIAGDVVDAQTAQNLSDKQAERLGDDLGIFLSQLHGINGSVVDAKRTKQTISLLQYYHQRIDQAAGSTHYTKARTVLQQVTNSKVPHEVVVHGDLHGLNMVIDPQTKRLVGVIDFSEVERGDPHQDFRKLFMTDERLLAPSIRCYRKLTGHTLSADTVKAWAYLNEWANICFFHDQPNHPTYKRAHKHLVKWQQL